MGSLQLDIQDVSVGYKANNQLLSGINLTVNSGEQIALVGENGRGKTTLLKTLCGIIPALKGQVNVEGTSLSSMSARQLASVISLVLTEKPSIGDIKVNNLIAFGRYPFTNWLGIQRAEDKQKVEEAVSLCGIGDLLNKVFYELSDGERQKVMMARAIAQDTRIIILDEPTSHLDISNKLAIMDLLSTLSKQKDMLVIYSTHEIELALKNADRMWLIKGDQLYDQRPEELLKSKLLSSAFALPENYFNEIKL